MSAPHLATPTNFFLHLAFSGPLSSPHAYATRAGPTLDWPLSSYKPGSPRALTCSPLRACQSCLPGAQRLIRVAPISHLLCGLLALSSAPLLYSLHRLVSQSTRNMIDWLGFLFPCAFLYTTKLASCLWRSCLQTSALFQQALHSPRATLQPSSRMPMLGASFSCLHALMPFVSARHSVALCLGFPTLAGETPQGVRLCPTCAGASGTHVCSARYLQPPTVPAMRVCPPLIMSFSCLSHELLPSVSAQSLMRVAPARH